MDDADDDVIAQVALDDIPCDLCNKYRDVVWWCKDCEQLLCDTCKKIHLKSKVSKDHRVIHKDEKTAEITDDRYCGVHDSILNMFCKDCGVAVCTDCMIGDHNTHQLDKIENTAQRQKSELETLIKNIRENKEVALKDKISKGLEYMKKVEINNGTLKQTSEETKKLICEDLDNIVKQECDNVTKQLLEVEGVLGNLRGDVKDCEDQMATVNGVKFLSVFKNLKDRLVKHTSNFEEPESQLSMPSFSSDNITEVFLRKLICHLNEVKVNILLSFNTVDIFGVVTDKCISPTISNDHIWIGNEDEKALALLSRDGTLLRNIKVNRVFDSLVVGKTGQLLCTYWAHSVIKKLSDEKLKDLKHDSISPYHFRCVYKTDNGELLCGVISPEDQEGSKVILLSESGSLVKTYQFSSIDSSVLFDDPYCLIQNKNKDIWMVECESSPVKVVSDDSRLKFKYYGMHANSTTNRKFNALGLECDKLGRVLISDKYNHCIHLVDEDGQFIRYIITQDDGILYPTTIMRAEDQSIWVLSEHGRKLYLISYLSKVMTLHVESHNMS